MGRRLFGQLKFTLALVVAVSLAVPWVAFADSQQVDNNLVASGNQNVVGLSAVAGVTVNTSAQIVVKYSGQNHALAGTSLTFKVQASQTTIPAPYTVTDAVVSIPANWGPGNIASAWSNISFTSPAAAGGYSYTVKWLPSPDPGNAVTGAAALVINLEATPAEEVNALSADITPPMATITTPTNGAIYLIGQAVAASYACEDPAGAPNEAVSGIASCVGDVANGANIDTASVGPKTFTVVATDNAGNQASAQHSYNVTYGICAVDGGSGLPKQNAKSGSTIPVKLRLCDAGGNNLSSSAITVTATSIVQQTLTVDGTVQDSGQANSPDSNFRYSADLGGYIYNLSTKGLGTGTYNLYFAAGNDQIVHAVQFGVK